MRHCFYAEFIKKFRPHVSSVMNDPSFPSDFLPKEDKEEGRGLSSSAGQADPKLLPPSRDHTEGVEGELPGPLKSEHTVRYEAVFSAA